MNQVLLSFDTEEFDVPRERGADISVSEAVEISRYGTERVLEVLRRHDVRATFFCTALFAEARPELVRRMVAEGHEVAAHGYRHDRYGANDVARARRAIEAVCDRPVLGYRQPRMGNVSDLELREAGYIYNSSLNPTFLPGRYMRLRSPRRPFMSGGLLQIPVSVTPWLRFPMFWLSCHHLPRATYRWLVRRVIRHDGFFITYFHPWEFYPLGKRRELNVPRIISRNSGEDMERRLEDLIIRLRHRGARFVSFSEFAENLIRHRHEAD